MPKHAFIKSSVGLVPADHAAEEWFHKIKPGRPVDVTVTLPRNKGFHRKFFVMLNMAYQNYDWPDIQTAHGPSKCTYDKFREHVTIKSGHWKYEVTPEGKVVEVADSIAFDKMEQDEFERLYSDVLDVILMNFLTNWTRGDMEYAVNQMMTFT